MHLHCEIDTPDCLQDIQILKKARSLYQSYKTPTNNLYFTRRAFGSILNHQSRKQQCENQKRILQSLQMAFLKLVHFDFGSHKPTFAIVMPLQPSRTRIHLHVHLIYRELQ